MNDHPAPGPAHIELSGTYYGPVVGQGILVYIQAAAQADVPDADALLRRLHKLQGNILDSYRATGAAPRVQVAFGRDRLVPHPDLRLAPELLAGGTGIRRVAGPAGPSGPQALLERFEAADCRMLLAGNGGAGKTEQLFMIAETLHARAAAALNARNKDGTSPRASIPVVVPLKGLKESSETGLDYVLRYITNTLGLGSANREQVARWIATGRITLLIDGLDTLPSEQHAPFIEGLNQLCTADDSWDIHLLVTTRRDEYLSHSVLLNLHEAVELQPLTADQLKTSLEQAVPPAGRQALERLRTWLTEVPDAASLLSSPLTFTIHALIAMEGTTPSSHASALGIPWTDYIRTAIDADTAEIPVGVNPDPTACLAFLTWCAGRLRDSGGRVLPAQVPQEWLTPDLKGVLRWRMLACELPLFLYSVITGWLVLGQWGAVCGFGLTAFPYLLYGRYAEYRAALADYETNLAGAEDHRRTQMRLSVWTPVLAAVGGVGAYIAQRLWSAVSRGTWTSPGTFSWAWITFGCLAGFAIGLAGNRDAKRLLVDGRSRGDFDLTTVRPSQLVPVIWRFAAPGLTVITFLSILPGIAVLAASTAMTLGPPAPGAHIPRTLDAFISALRDIAAAAQNTPVGDLYPRLWWLVVWVTLGAGWAVCFAADWILQIYFVMPLKETLLREEGVLPGPWGLTLTFLRDYGLLRDSWGYYEFVHDDLLEYLQEQAL